MSDILESLSNLPNYVEHRKRFLNQAAAKGFTVESVKIPGVGIQGEDLFQDYAFNQNTAATTYVFISGVHGIEGYIGSDIQNQIFNSKNLKSEKFNLLLVHAVNPFGMSWYRRPNGNNVDLNRNSLEDRSHIPSDSMKIFSKFIPFLKASSPLEFVFKFPKQLILAAQFGFRKVFQVLSSGQYQHPQSLFYMGAKPEIELVELRSRLSQLMPSTKNWVIVDVHSGLGPFCFDSLMIDGSDPAEVKFFAEATDPTHVQSNARSETYYQAHGVHWDAFRREWVGKKIYWVSLEFGTFFFLRMYLYMVLENTWFQKGQHQDIERIKLNLNSFYPDIEHWRQTCLKIGLERFHQIWKAIESSNSGG